MSLSNIHTIIRALKNRAEILQGRLGRLSAYQGSGEGIAAAISDIKTDLQATELRISEEEATLEAIKRADFATQS